MATSRISDELWNEFHQVVNMTSRELAEWLRSESAGEVTEVLPDQAGSTTGQQVVHILDKRRTDLTDEDMDVMERVVRRVRGERRGDLEPTAGDPGWRRSLMTIGHDPLKPSKAGAEGWRTARRA